MNIVCPPRPKGEISVTAADGSVYVFPTVMKAVRAIGGRHYEASPCGTLIVVSRGWWMQPETWRFADAEGRRVPASCVLRCAELMAGERRRRHASKGFPSYDPADFRNGPVPRTGGRRRWGRWYRHPRTTQERRMAVAVLADPDCEGVKIRGRRRDKGLPHVWDEVPVGERGRTWKDHRKTQWK